MIQAPAFVSALPLYQLFVKDTASMDSDGGAQAAFFFDGQLYDNVFIRLKGGTTKDLAKKAHRVDFNRERLFAFAPDQKPVRELALNVEFIDPSYLRQNISFWFFNLAGTPAPLHFPVRLHLNGAFHELAFHTETMDTALLSRIGVNPDGALYKNALMLNILPEPAIGGRDCLEAEKQTRIDEDFSDLINWTRGIAETNTIDGRRRHLFDTTDIPWMINYLACFHLTQQADGVHANVCPHRDSGGNDEWRLIPWDMNLSMGQVWAIDHVSGSEDAVESHPFYGASGWRDSNIGWSYNRLFDSLILVPETREMYLRRLRTLMDRFLQAPGAPRSALLMESRIEAMRDRILPEALLDRKKWGWSIGYGGYAMTNVPFGQAVDELMRDYVQQRRTHLFAVHNVDNVSYANRANIPNPQPILATLQFGAIEATPGSGNQEEEFIEIVNTNGFAVDVSGWKLEGGARFECRPGTVIPSGRSLYLSPNVKAFRARKTAPSGGAGLFVQGPYSGGLSARGEEILFKDDCGRVVASRTTLAQPSPAQNGLRISEIMFHPASPAAGPYTSADFEFVELVNAGPSALNLAGVRITGGVDFDFTASGVGSLPSGERLVVVKNIVAFRSRYGDGPTVAGAYAGSLDNQGESLHLRDASGEEILQLSYDPSWWHLTDGLGFSLTARDEHAAVEAWGSRAQWRPSAQSGGSPGLPDTGSTLPFIEISEVLANAGAGQLNAVEFFNPTDSIADIGHWSLTDDPSQPNKYALPVGALLPAHGYWVVPESLFNPKPGIAPSFALNPLGGRLVLFSRDIAGHLSGYEAAVDYGGSELGVSLGSARDGEGSVRMVPVLQASLGSANPPAALPTLAITEVHYHAPPNRDGALDEFVEVFNPGLKFVALADPSDPAIAWRIRGDVDFDFPPDMTLPPGGFVVLVGFDPASNPQLAASFRARWGFPSLEQLSGPYRKQLAHHGGTLALEQGMRTTGGVGYRTVDVVAYDDREPWPEAADGSGPSLTRNSLARFGDEPGNWRAAAPSPGRWPAAGSPPRIVESPVDASPPLNTSMTIRCLAVGGADLGFQWRRNGTPIAGATQPSFTLTAAGSADAGCYDVVVYDDSGVAISGRAVVAPQRVPLFTAQPAGKLLPVGVDATLRASVIGTGPVSFQWYRNDALLTDATNSALTLSNAQVSQSGVYRVRAADSLGVAVSEGAQITIAARPTVLIPPMAVAVVAGETAVMSVVADGTPPFTYRWKRGAFTLATITLNAPSCFLTISNAQALQTGLYSVTVVNVIGASTATPSVALSLLGDTDGDRMPDVWETSHKLNPQVADAQDDADHDGVSNYGEYLAGTDPQDPTSLLRLNLKGAGDIVSLDFLAQTNRTYLIQQADTLGGTWSPLASFPARGVVRVEEARTAGQATGSRYFRLITPASNP